MSLGLGAGAPLACEAPIAYGPNKGKPATGTTTGYGRHLRVGEPACEACITGHRERQRNWNAQNPGYMAEYRRQWRAKNPHWERANSLRYYNLTLEQFDALFASQGSACAICQTTEPNWKGHWHIDHDHACCPGNRSCGACVRGVLCMRCNVALGHLGDDPDVLRRAAEYLGRKRV